MFFQGSNDRVAVKVLKKIIHKASNKNKIEEEKESNIQIMNFCENEKTHYMTFVDFS